MFLENPSPSQNKSIREYLELLEENPQQLDQDNFACYAGLSEQDKEKLKNSGYEVHSGKVRDCISKGKFFHMLHSDRLSAFDRYITLVPFKGLLLSKINLFWLKKAQKEGFPIANFIESEERVITMKNLELIPVEVVVRGHLAGSMLRAYEKGERTFCQHTLKDGLPSWGELPETIVTPTSKAEVGGHDENTTPEALLKSGICTREEWEKIEDLALKLYEFGKKHYDELGWILVDSKYEFARDQNGNIFLVDELHTPDSSRLWVQESYKKNLSEGKTPEMLDKEIIRRFLMKKGFKGEGDIPEVPAKDRLHLSKVYLSVAEKLLGEGALNSLDQAV